MVTLVNGIELAYESFGAAERDAILLIAGMGSQMVRWTVPFCEQLAAHGFRVIRFDNRDAGCSTHFRDCVAPDLRALTMALKAGRQPDVPYTLDDMAADVVGLIDALGLERIHVVGRSMGGMIAQIMASEYPHRIRSLTSIMSTINNPTLPKADPGVVELMLRPAPDPRVDQAGYLAHSLAFAQRIAGSRYPLDEEAHRSMVLEELGRAYDPSGRARQIAAMAVCADRRSRLATIGAPTLVIHGTDDPLIPLEHGRDSAASIPNAQFMQIEGMGHVLPQPLYGVVIDSIVCVARR